MEAFLQHMKSLREHMNDHEDKVALLSAEQSEHQAQVRHLEEDLESVRTGCSRAKVEIETFQKKSGETSKQIISCRKGIETLDVDSHALSQAWELLNENLRKQSSSLIEKKLYYEKLQADARSQLDHYQAYFQSRPPQQQIEEVDAKIRRAAEGIPGDHEATTNNVEKVEAGDHRDGTQLADAETRLRQLQEESRLAEEELTRVTAETAKLETEHGALKDELAALEEERLAEEAYMQSLYDRLGQLQNFSQGLVCGSCQHAYIIEFKDSNFVVREAGSEQ